MKILHIVQFLGIGGLEKVLYLLIQQQLAHGHKVKVLIYDYERTWVDFFKTLDIEFIESYQKKKGIDLGLVGELNKHVDSFDIVHTHDLNPAIYIGMLRMKRNLPFQNKRKDSKTLFVHTTHGMEHIKESPKTFYYEKYFTNKADRIVSVSPTFYDFYADLEFPMERLAMINNGIAIEQTMPPVSQKIKGEVRDEFNIPAQHKVWINIARIVPLKDQKLLIEACEKCEDTSLIIVGPAGDEDFFNEIHTGHSENIHFAGPRSDIKRLLAGSDYFISASHHEGLPISVLEAGAAGIPCILSDIPGHQCLEEESSEKIASFFELKSATDLVSKYKSLINDKKLEKEMVNNFFRKITQRYSAKTMYDSYQKVYTGVEC
jgi:glycosyltransferase involved in cell wall biosynthesis